MEVVGVLSVCRVLPGRVVREGTAIDLMVCKCHPVRGSSTTDVRHCHKLLHHSLEHCTHLYHDNECSHSTKYSNVKEIFLSKSNLDGLCILVARTHNLWIMNRTYSALNVLDH